MKKFFLVAVMLLALVGCSGNSVHPTQEEWLEVYLAHEIEQVTDLWKTRISTQVVIIKETKEILVTITIANGEEQLQSFAKDLYIDSVKGIVDRVIQEYAWAINFKITVQFL